MSITLILDNIRSVHNVGSIFRTADCFGVNKIYLCGTTPTPIDRFGRTRSDLVKVALGAELTIPWEYHSSTNELVRSLQEGSTLVYALEQSPQSTSLPDFAIDNPRPVALVVGYEVAGVSSDILTQVNGILEIPQWGTKESLNVSVATGIALYQLRTHSN